MNKCSIENCPKKYYAKTLCVNHYMMNLRHGNPLFQKPKSCCAVSGCIKKYKAKGYCQNHYDQWILHGNPLIRVKEKHGMNASPEYRAWRHMKERCYRTKDEKYPIYGGRGIIVCNRWKNSFSAFYADMGDKPSPTHSIDRKNVDGNYEISNCRWATPREQAANRRKQTNNTSGYTGAKKSTNGNGWMSYISYDRIRYHLGIYATPEEAAYIRDQFAMALDINTPLNFEY